MDLRNMMYAARSHFIFTDRYEKVILDVPFENKTIDMILVDQKEHVTILLFAETNWKRALLSARSVALGAHSIYLCVPDTNCPPSLKVAAYEQGVGIYLCNPTGQLKKLIPSHPSHVQTSYYEAVLRAANAKWIKDHTPRTPQAQPSDD